MALMQKDVDAAYSSKAAKPQEIGAGSSDTLTFIAEDGEVIVFDGMDISIEEASALAGEDALGKVWNRPAEELAWRDM